MMAASLKVAQTMSYLIRKIMLEFFDSTYNKLFIHVSQPHFTFLCFPKQSGILSKPLNFKGSTNNVLPHKKIMLEFLTVHIISF